MPSSGVQTCARSEEHTSELQSHDNLVCRLLLEKKKFERQPLPGERVAFPDGARAVLERDVVDREGPRRPDLVLSAVTVFLVTGGLLIDHVVASQLLVE